MAELNEMVQYMYCLYLIFLECRPFPVSKAILSWLKGPIRFFEVIER